MAKKFSLTREQYKRIKKMDHRDMSDWLQRFFTSAYDQGRDSAEGIGETKIREVLHGIKGIGAKRTEEIIKALNEEVNKEKGEALTDGKS